MSVVLKQLWLAMLLEKFRFESTWAAGIRSETSFVGNDVIHLNKIGADPKVLINNTIYPIATASREDNDVIVSLSKYETENTRISDDELYGLPYDKPGSVLTQHRETLQQGMMAHGLFTIAPLQATTGTPVLVTTGPTAELLPDGTYRRRLVPEDIIRHKRKYDDLKIPKLGRKLVLCSEHVEDLLLTSQVFKDQYHNITEGKILPLYGFEIHEDVNTVSYTLSTKVRKAYGATSLNGDAAASVSFYNGRVFQATGSQNMYYREASLDPETRSSVAGFRQYGIIMPYDRDSQGAIISGRNATATTVHADPS